MSEPVKRRRRPPISCTICRKRKIKCDKQFPCNHCIRSRNPAACQYDNPWPGAPRPATSANISPKAAEAPSFIAREHDAPSSDAPTLVDRQSLHTVSTISSPADVDSMQRRIRELEEQLSRVPTYQEPLPERAPTPSNIETVSTGLSGAFHIEVGGPLLGKLETQASSRIVAHKTRVFGQSHWIGCIVLFRDLAKEIEPSIKTEKSKAVELLIRCKALGRFIKSQRRPPWPTPPTSDLPSKELADELLGCYLRTFETVYRVLHLPTFKADYEALWYPDAKPDPGFLVQVKLVLAIGAEAYDMIFSLRTSAIRWIYEAQTWAAEPNAKSRLNITTLQTHVLLLIAKEMISNSGDAVWISVGSLIRMAMYMGLHREPGRLPKQDTHTTEMRRRLWNTILEMSLQASLTAGGAPLISIDDFDIAPPSNLDDEQITLTDPAPRYENEQTQMSVAIALQKSFSVRLDILKFLNSVNSPATYARALELDTALRASYRTISKTLRSQSASPFAMQFVDFLMNRYIIALHMPFYERALNSASCAYSRKTVVDAALKIWYTSYPEGATREGEAKDIEKIITSVSGLFKSVPTQAMCIIALEIRAQILEDEGLNRVPVRKDLLTALYEGKTWLFRCIEAGEVNVKGYIFHSVINAQIEHLMEGDEKESLAGKLIRAAEDSAETALAVLEKEAAEWAADEGDVACVDFGEGSIDMNNIDFMMSDSWLSGADQMNWIFDETTPMW